MFRNGELDYPDEGSSFGGSAVRQDFRTFGPDGFAYTPSLSTEAERMSAGYNALDIMPCKVDDDGPEFIPAAGDLVWVLQEDTEKMNYSPELGVFLHKVYPTVGMNAYVAKQAADEGNRYLPANPAEAQRVALAKSEEVLAQFVCLGICYQIQPAADLKNYRITFWTEGSVPLIPLMTTTYMGSQKQLIGEDAGFVFYKKRDRAGNLLPYVLGGQHRPLSAGPVAMADADAKQFVIYRGTAYEIWQAIPAFIPREYVGPALRIGSFQLDPLRIPRHVDAKRDKAWRDASLTKPVDSGDFDSPYVMFAIKVI